MKIQIKIQHTPTPWQYDPTNDNESEDLSKNNSLGSIMGSQYHVARIWADGDNPKADAEFIVRAVNSHEDLLGCLKNIIARNWVDEETDAYEEILEVIAEAEGKGE